MKNAARLIQPCLTGGVCLLLALVAFNNMVDYGSNFNYVQHIMSMSDVQNPGMVAHRSIKSPALHHLFYFAIIATETLAAALCGIGAVQMLRNLGASSETFERSKSAALLGLCLSCLLWLAGFLAIGGEWFLMWQSPTWNAQNSAFRMFAISALALVVVKPSNASSDQ